MRKIFLTFIRAQRLWWALQVKVGRLVDSLDRALQRTDGHLPVTEKQTFRRVTAWHRDRKTGLLCKSTYETRNSILIARLLSLPMVRVGRFGTIAVDFGSADSVPSDLKEMITNAERIAGAGAESAGALLKINTGGLVTCQKVASGLSN